MIAPTRATRSCAIAISLLFLASCAAVGEVGYSALTQLNDRVYLFAQDLKEGTPGDRLGLLQIDQNGRVSQTMIEIDNWADIDGRANDLESACVLPGTDDEVLVAESSYYKEKFGRIFRIRLDSAGAKIIGVYHLPEKDIPANENYEGMVCFEKDGRRLVVLGERRSGLLRIGVLAADASGIDWDQLAASPVRIEAPESWADADDHRSISDLYMDAQGSIWAVGAQDPGDTGPFRSVIYRAATTAETDAATPIEALPATEAAWIIDGFKVEGLAGPPDSKIIPGARLSIGTEDEGYPGAWRPLPDPTAHPIDR